MMLTKRVQQLLAVCVALAIIGAPVLTAVADTSIYSEPFFIETPQKAPTMEEETEAEVLTQSEPEAAPIADEHVTVSFYVGDQLYLAEQIDANTLARTPQDPDPQPDEGHFVGWFAGDASSPFDFNTIVESDLALTARFSEQYLVQFLDVRGSVAGVSWVDAGAAVTPYDSDELTISADKQFIHWYEEGEAPEVPFDFAQEIDRNIRLRPYLKDTLLLVFVSEGTQVPPQVINPQEKVTLPANAEMTRPGYAFRHWSTERNGETPYVPDYETASLTLYAVWEKQRVTYSVIYWKEKPNISGDPSLPADYMYAYTRTGNDTYAGDVIQMDAAKAKTLLSTVTADATYLNTHFTYVQGDTGVVALGDGSAVVNVYYSRNTYQVTFDFNSGTTAAGLGASAFRLVNDTEDRPLSFGNSQYVMSVKLDQNVHEIWPYSVTLSGTQPFSLWGGWYSLSQDSSATFSETMYNTFTNDLKKYNFKLPASYNKSADFVTRMYYLEVAEMPDDATLASGIASGKYEWFTYGVARLYEYHPEYNSSYQQAGTVPSGYKGWPGKSLPGFRTANTTRNGDHQLYPIDLKDAAGQPLKNDLGQTMYELHYYMDRLSYKITWNAMGGRLSSGKETAVAATILFEATVPDAVFEEVPVKENATFVGWFYDQAFQEPAVPGILMPGYDVVLYAKYESSGVTVSFYESDDAASPMAVKHTSPGGLVSYPDHNFGVGQSYDGLGVFKGWSFYISGIPAEFSDTMPIAADMSVYAQWEGISYTITYYVDNEGSGELETQQLLATAGQDTLAKHQLYTPIPPTPAGYAFLGWYTDPAGAASTRFTAGTPVTGDLAVYPVFAKPLTIGAINDVYSNTNQAKAVDGVLYWGSGLTSANLVAAADPEVSTGHSNVTIRSIRVDVGNKTLYPPTQASKDALAPTDAYLLTLTVTDSIGRNATASLPLYVWDDSAPKVGGGRELVQPVGIGAQTTQAIFDELIGQASLSDDFATAQQLYESLRVSDTDIDFAEAGTYFIDYTVTDTVGNETTVRVDVTIYQPYVDVNVIKVWADDENALGGRPAEVRIQLYRTLPGGQPEPVEAPVTFSGGSVDTEWVYPYGDLLACDNKGVAYVYSVEELDIHPNYTASYEGLTITGTLQTTVLDGEKEWNILGTGYEKPESIAIELYRSDAPNQVLDTRQVRGTGDTWAFSFDGLLAYDAAGEPYTYTVREAENEIPAYIESTVLGTTITNTYAADEIIQVRTEWDHTGAPQDMRPDGATLILLRDGAEYARATVTAADAWQASFTVPQRDYVGSVFTLAQEAVTQYDTSYDETGGALVARNAFVMPMLEISGSKQWSGTPNGYNVPSVIVDLLRNGEAEGQSLQIASGQQDFTFPQEVPQYDDDGEAYAYTVQEHKVPAYDTGSDDTGLHLTNAYNPVRATYEVVGTKAVTGEGAPDEEFTFTMIAQDADQPMPAGSVGGSLTVTAKAGSIRFGALLFPLPGDYVYEIREVPGSTRGFAYDDEVYTLTLTVIDGGEGALLVDAVIEGVRDSAPQGIVFTNVYTIPTDDVVVTKVWADNGNALGVRPDEVEVQLYRTPAGGLTEVVDSPVRFGGGETDDSWTHTIPAQPVHDTQGRAYTYSVREQHTNPNYIAVSDGLTVTNTIQPISVTLTKVWNILGTGFEKPDAVTFELWRTPAGGAAERVLDSVSLSGASLSAPWTKTVATLPAYDKDGNLYTYTAQEPNPPFATTAEAGGLTITNTYAADQEILVAKTWNHTGSPSHPASATITLHRNGVESPYASAEVGEENDWQHVFKVPQKDYLEATFEVREAEISDYSATISGDAENGFTVHNEYVMPKDTVSGAKTWVDIPESGVGKPSVIISLHRSDDPAQVLDSTLLAADDTYSFSGLDRYDAQGQPYVYTVSESATPGFDQRQDGLNFTNTYAPDDAYVPVNGEKRIWGDTGYPDTSFAFTLTRLTAGAPMPKGAVGDTTTVTAGEGAFTFGSIAYTVPGTFAYQIRETVPTAADATEGFAYDVAVYELTVTVTFADGVLSTETVLTRNGEAADSILFNNGYFTPTRPVTVTMAWADGGDELDVRPDGVELMLERTPAGGGKEDVESRVVQNATGDSWETTFVDMPVHDALGRAYTYSVRELHTSPNYASESNGLTVTDTIQPISKTLIKEWNIVGTKFEKPASVTFELWRTPTGGAAERVLERVVLSGSSLSEPWTETVNNLPAYDKDGNLYTYTVQEPNPPFATTAEASGQTVTNTYAADAEIEITKHWDYTGAPADQRPDQVTVALYRTDSDGTALYQTVTLRENEGWHAVVAVPQVDYLEADFSLEELAVEGYHSDISGNAVDGFVVNNAFEMPLDSISGAKTWLDVPAIVTTPAVVINLWRSDDAVTPYQTYTLQSGAGTYEFSGLPRYDDDGNAYVYTVEEATPPGYVSEKQDETDFTNTYAPQSIGFTPTAQKAIPGDTGFPSTDFAFVLQATGAGETHPMPVDSVNGIKTVRRTGIGALDFGEMTFTRPGDYLYEVAEVIPADAQKTEGFAYDTTVYELALTVRDEGDGTLSVNPVYRVKDGGDVAGFIFENVYTTPKQDIAMEVRWVDQEDILTLRPEEVQVQLQRTVEGGVPENVGTPETLRGDTNLWLYTFPDMPVHDEAGNPYTYAILAQDVDAHYTADVTGFILTNTLKEARITGIKEATPAPVTEDTVPVVNPGDTLTYRITLQNTGDRSVYDTRVMDTLPAGVTLQEDAVIPAPEATLVNADGATTLMWKLPVIEANDSLTIVLPVTVDAPAEGELSRLMENTAYYRLAEHAGESIPLVSGVADDPAGYTTTQTVAHQLITLEQRTDVAEDTYLVEGQQVAYTLTLHNAAAIAGIEVWDMLPDGMTLVPDSTRSSLHPAASDTFHSGGILNFPETAVPAGGAVFTFQAAVDKLSGVLSLPLVNRATASATVSSGAPAVDSAVEPITHIATRREVSIDLTARLYNGETAEEWTAGTLENPVPTTLGQTIEYRLTLQSAGYLPHGEVLVTQPLEQGMTFVEGSTVVLEADSGVSVTPSKSGEELRWLISGLPMDETVVFTFRVIAPSTTGDDTVRDLREQATVEDLGLGALTTYAGNPVYTDVTQLSSQSGLTVHRLAIPLVETAKTAGPAGENGKAVALEAGDIITYTIQVRNTGHAEAMHVRVMDILPEGLSFVGGSLLADGEALTDGSARTLSSGLRLTPYVVAGNGQTVLYWVIDALEGENALTHPGMEEVTLTFEASVTDTGRGQQLSNTAYTLVPDANDPAPAPPSGTENPAAYVPSPSPVQHQTFSFTAAANPAGGTDAASAARVAEGGKVTYTLTLEAGAAMDDVVVRDTLPGGMTLVPGSIRMVRPDGAARNIPDNAMAGGVVTWPATSVEAGQTKFECTVLVDKLPEGTLARTYQNAAQVSLDNGAIGAANKILTQQANDLFHSTDTGFNAITKRAALIQNGVQAADENGAQDAPVGVKRGQQVAYTIVVDRTAAPGNRSGNLVITDTLPKGMTLVSGSIQGTVSGGHGQVTSARQVRNAVEWVVHGLADGESVTLSFTAEVAASQDAAASNGYLDFVNQAALLDTGLESLTYAAAVPGHAAGSRVYEAAQYALVSNSTFHRVQFSALTAVKSASEPEGSIKAGAEMTYTILVTNQGQGDTLQVLVRDRIPDGLTYVNGSIASSVKGAAMEVRTIDGKPYATWILPAMAAGQRATLTFRVQVQELAEGQSFARYQNIAEYREADVANAAAVQLDDGKGFADTNMVEHYQSNGAQITVRKVAAGTWELLPDAVFTLTQLSAVEPENRWSEPSIAVTGGDGTAVFENLPAGNYILNETVAPEGYTRSTIRRSINISGVENRTVTISNRPAAGVLGEVDEELIGIGNRNVGLCKR